MKTTASGRISWTNTQGFGKAKKQARNKFKEAVKGTTSSSVMDEITQILILCRKDMEKINVSDLGLEEERKNLILIKKRLKKLKSRTWNPLVHLTSWLISVVIAINTTQVKILNQKNNEQN